MKEMWFDVHLVLAALGGDKQAREQLRTQAKIALHAPEGSCFLIDVKGSPSVGIPGDLVEVRMNARWKDAEERDWVKEQLAECFMDIYDDRRVVVRTQDEVLAEIAAEGAEEEEEDHDHALARERGANTSYDERDE